MTFIDNETATAMPSLLRANAHRQAVQVCFHREGLRSSQTFTLCEVMSVILFSTGESIKTRVLEGWGTV
jgi:hypothetical protein